MEVFKKELMTQYEDLSHEEQIDLMCFLEESLLKDIREEEARLLAEELEREEFLQMQGDSKLFTLIF